MQKILVQKKIGNINAQQHSKPIDWLSLHWYETNKRLLHKKTQLGKEISMRFLQENPQLTQGDILFEDDAILIAVAIMECEALIIHPKNMLEMAAVCYEIGNKHLPLFLHGEELLVAFEAPLFKLLKSGGYDVQQGKRKLINPLKTTVAPHGSSSDTLFSKILKLTNSSE